MYEETLKITGYADESRAKIRLKNHKNKNHKPSHSLAKGFNWNTFGF